jgi:hypothetical protein
MFINIDLQYLVMGLNEMFYSIAIFFILILIAYFILEYMSELTSFVKIFLSFFLAIILFYLGEYLRKRNI